VRGRKAASAVLRPVTSSEMPIMRCGGAVGLLPDTPGCGNPPNFAIWQDHPVFVRNLRRGLQRARDAVPDTLDILG